MEFCVDNFMNATMQSDSISLLESLAQTKFADCYQCGKCTAGCPRSAHMDKTPNQLIRMVQLGDVDAALKTDAIWQCVSCETCTARYEPRLLSRLRAARLFQRLRAVAARVPRRAGRVALRIDDWICCGATAAHSLNHKLAIALPARNLGLARGRGMPRCWRPARCARCNCCGAGQAMAGHAALRAEISRIVEAKWTTVPRVLNLIQVFQNASGWTGSRAPSRRR
jgi:hypothetical protein